MHSDPRSSAKPLAIATMLTPTERLRVDAAGDGWYQTIHRDSVAEVVQDLKTQRAGAVVLSVARCDSSERAAVAALVRDAVGFAGKIELDRSKPDGTPRKLMDVTKLARLGWKPRIALADGIRSTYRWYLDNAATARS